jgi:Phosphopantothenate-cysteine ligase (EC 6.3.2.5)/Phosphopantothenoylcysteine decarboxylase (EC 4.1.1.36)
MRWKLSIFHWQKKADVILVAPATANTIGKIANGIADNLLTTVIMATSKKSCFLLQL